MTAEPDAAGTASSLEQPTGAAPGGLVDFVRRIDARVSDQPG